MAMARNFERNQPVMLETAQPEADGAARTDARLLPKRPPSGRYSTVAFFFVSMASAFWVGIWGAYLWGYFGPQGLQRLELQQIALFSAAIVLPPLLFMAMAVMLGRASALARTSEAMMASAERLFAVDENVSRAQIEEKLRSVGIGHNEIHEIGPSLEDVFVTLSAK